MWPASTRYACPGKAASGQDQGVTQRDRFVRRFLGSGAKLALPLSLLLLVCGGAPVRAQAGGNQAGLVVVHGDGRVITRCVRFDETQITGLTLLQRSGLAFSADTGPMGSTICSLNNEGCPASDCWCECKGTPCAYWIYFQRNPDGSWGYANIGAALRQVSSGDVDGWMWGDASSLPPAVSFEAICGSPDSDPPDQDPVTSEPETSEPLSPTVTSTAPSTAPATGAPTVTSTAGAIASPTVPPDDATPTSPISRTPVATRTPIPTMSTAVPESIPVSLSPTATAGIPVTETEPAPTEVPGALPTTTDVEEPSRPSGYLAFVAVLGVIGGLSLLLRRQRRGP